MITEAQGVLPVIAQPTEAGSSTASNEQFNRFVEEHVDFVWRCVRRLGVPRNDCDDAVQQVLYVASIKLSNIEAGSERAFLFSTARRIAANARRSNRRQEDVRTGASRSFDEKVPSQDELSDQLRARHLMDRILETMTPELRETFILFELEEMSLMDIANLFGVPRGTVSSRLRRARESFREILRGLKTIADKRGES